MGIAMGHFFYGLKRCVRQLSAETVMGTFLLVQSPVLRHFSSLQLTFPALAYF
jgi:hypothetical protein